MFIRLLNKAEEAIISLLLVGMTLVVFADVVMRFGFDTGILWSEELTLHMSAWFVLFGASYGLKVGAHIGVDALVRLFPAGGQRLLGALAVLMSLAYCGLFLYGSWVYLVKMKRIGIELEDLPVPTWIAHGILIIGFALLSLRLLELLWSLATGRATGFARKDEVDESIELAAKLKQSQREGDLT
jgi:C4-dicarboxylate transporter DctQ subunit